MSPGTGPSQGFQGLIVELGISSWNFDKRNSEQDTRLVLRLERNLQPVWPSLTPLTVTLYIYIYS